MSLGAPGRGPGTVPRVADFGNRGKGGRALRPSWHPRSPPLLASAARLPARAAARGQSPGVGISGPWALGAAGLARWLGRIQSLPPGSSRFSRPRTPQVSPVLAPQLQPPDMEPPVQIFRGEPGSTCAPSTCLPPNGSVRFPGWAEPDRNSSAGSEDAPPEPEHISPVIPVIITAVYSVVFVVGLVGNSLVMFVIVR